MGNGWEDSIPSEKFILQADKCSPNMLIHLFKKKCKSRVHSEPGTVPDAQAMTGSRKGKRLAIPGPSSSVRRLIVRALFIGLRKPEYPPLATSS